MPTDTEIEDLAIPEEQTEESHGPAEQEPPKPARRGRTLILAALVVALAGAGVFRWWQYSQTYESTDDAQIDGHLNPIAARISGTITAVYAEDNQFVKAGQPLVDLDTRDYQVAKAQTAAQYDQAQAQLRGERPNLPITQTSNVTDAATAQAQLADANAAISAAEHDYASALSQLAEAEANNAKAQSDLRRYKQLIDKQEVAQSEYDQYAAAAKAQAAAVEAQKESAAATARTIEQRRAQAAQKQIALQQTVDNAPRQIQIRDANILARAAGLESIKAQLVQDDLNIAYCHIVAPVAGIVSQRSAELGARIAVGQQLMMLVQTGDLWVTANFKETQLRRMRAGRRVTIKVDALDKTFEGYLDSMPAATGDRTSALPPENATGNYVKIVQRLPVRIRFKPGQAGFEDLRPGMSVVPKVRFD
jgi:membrane fusion protein (multidrug efflux system)